MAQPAIPIKSYGQRLVRGLSTRQSDLMVNFLPTISLDGQTNWNNLISGYSGVALEIGFGTGNFILKNAAQNPDVLHLGCEPYLNGVVSLLGRVEEQGIKNIRVFIDDVRMLFETMPLGILNQIYVICSDPWPKKKHSKRRLLNHQFLDRATDFLAKNGNITIATDHQDYAQFILSNALRSGKLTVPSTNLDDYKQLPADWYYTKFQKKGLSKGHEIYYFNWGKKEY